MASTTKVIMYDEVLYGEGHLIGRWAAGIAREGGVNIRSFAPTGWRANKTSSSLNRPGGGPAGNLKKRITSGSQRIGLREIEIEFRFGAYYTMWVNDGTPTHYARDAGGRFAAADEEGGGMYLPPNGAFRGRWVQRRRGQRGQKFIEAGIAATAAHHSSLQSFRRV